MSTWLLSLLWVTSPAWHTEAVIDGYVVQGAVVAGSEYQRLRVTHATPFPAALLALAVWGRQADDAPVSDYVREHVLVSDGAFERLYYDVVYAPLLSPRDYVLRVARMQRGERYEITYRSVLDERYPPRAERLRIAIDGRCVITPRDDGGSEIRYEIFTELGGTLPAWIARRPQQEQAVAWVKAMLMRADKLAAETSAETALVR